jgi:hypothetical protein
MKISQLNSLFLDRRRFFTSVARAASMLYLGSLTVFAEFAQVTESSDDEFTIINGWVLTRKDLAARNNQDVLRL